MEGQFIYDEFWILSSDEEQLISMPVLKRGRKTLTKRHPELVPVLSNFIRDNSAEAHNKRQTLTTYTNRVTLNDIKKHVIGNVPGLQSVSRSTIHRMMNPPPKGTINAKRYTGLVDARVPPKKNNATQDHVDYSYAAVKYVQELATLCDSETIMYSCDDKNKINVGALVVSRHFQIKMFFTKDDQPNYFQ